MFYFVPFEIGLTEKRQLLPSVGVVVSVHSLGSFAQVDSFFFVRILLHHY